MCPDSAESLKTSWVPGAPREIKGASAGLYFGPDPPPLSVGENKGGGGRGVYACMHVTISIPFSQL